MPRAQLFAIMRREINNRDTAAWACDARRFGQSLGGVCSKVQHLMQKDGVKMARIKRQIRKIALHQIDLHRGQMLKLGARNPQHFQILVERHNTISASSEQLGHPPRSRSNIEQDPKAVAVQSLLQARFNLAIRAVQRAQFIPFTGVSGKVLVGGFFAALTNGGELTPVVHARLGEAGFLCLGNRKDSVQGGHHWPRIIVSACAAQEHPAAFSAALSQARVAQDTNMARDAGLALTKSLSKLADSQLHGCKQSRDAKPRGIGKSLKHHVNRDRRGRVQSHNTHMI